MLRGLGPGLDNEQANPTAVLYSYLVEPDTYFNAFLLSAAKNAAEVGNMANYAQDQFIMKEVKEK